MVAAQNNDTIKRALEVLEEVSADQKLRDQYFYRNLARMDEEARLDYAREEGMAAVFALIEQGLTPEEAKKKLGLK